jgi:hypothetical protein
MTKAVLTLEDDLLSKPDSVKGKIQRIALAYIREKESRGEIPTAIRFLFYELSQQGHVSKRCTKLDGTPGKRKADQDLICAVTVLREEGLIPWDWIVDESRKVHGHSGSATVAKDLINCLNIAHIDPWLGGKRPVIVTESRGVGGVVDRTLGEPYVINTCATGGMCHGFIVNEVAPLVEDEDTVVGYIGDDDLAGGHIEGHTKSVLEHHTGRIFTDETWVRLAVTEEQREEFKRRGIDPIRKKDKRHKGGKPHWAYEAEALGQGVLIGIVRDFLDSLLLEPIKSVHEREIEERAKLIKLLNRGRR